jgi:ABC-type nitrate/sulfonate/bicarbonate transport system substrate-binding protein
MAALSGAAVALPRHGRAQGRSEIGKLSMGFGLDPVFAPHIVAMDKGWLKEAGFTDIATPSFTSGATAGEALLSGDIQLWTPGNLPPISMAQSGLPVLVLGTNCIATAADNLVARKDANIRAPEDLYRIKIGLLDGSTASATLAGLAKYYGLDQKRLQVVNMPPPEQFASLKSNAIQALLCWEPWGHNALALGDTMLVHSGVESGFEKNKGAKAHISATRSLLVTSEDFVRRNPNATALLMAALVRGQRYVSDPANRAAVLDRVAAVTKQDRALVEAIWGEYSFDPSFDQAYVDDMRAMADYLVSSGRAKAAKDPLDYTYSAPAAAAGATVTVPGRWKP